LPSLWKLGGIRMSVTSTWARQLRLPPAAVVVVGRADDIEIGSSQHGPHASRTITLSSARNTVSSRPP